MQPNISRVANICTSTIEFLRAILPPDCTYFLVLHHAAKGVTHKPYTSLDDMAAAAMKYDTLPDVTVYHACAGYGAGHVMAAGKKKFRTGQNLKAMQALWVDLDCGEDKAKARQGYATKKDAAASLWGFCEDTGFPAPMLVDSGRGLHAYWPLTQAIPPDIWQKTAMRFKIALAQHGVIADPSRTADGASILRPPGTRNKKDQKNPKAVRVMNPVTATSIAKINAILDNLLGAEAVAADALVIRPAYLNTVASNDLNADLTAHAYPDVPADADLMATKCKQAGLFKETGCNDEPTWKAMIGVVRLCVGGEAVAHAWSRKSAQYSQAETQRKIDTCIDKPATCAHIESCNPAGCTDCPVKGTVATPLQLGRVSPPAAAPIPRDALADIQSAYALIRVGGSLGIVDLKSLRQRQRFSALGALQIMGQGDGRLLILRHLKAYHPKADSKAIVGEFFIDPSTTMYNGVDFTPGAGKDEALNLWGAPTLVPVQGAWPILADFMLSVICAGDENIYQYLIRYLAHALQFPQVKPGVMVTLVGGQGTGKGTLFALVMKLWGATTLLTSRMDDVVGNFNDSLEGSMFVLLDEAQFAGDRRAADALKSLVTSPEIRINPKGQAQRTIPSVHRIIAATNHAHAATREHDDRRDLTLRVSDIHKGDYNYWEKVYGAIDGETPAMMHDLLAMDLSGFNIRQKPDTGELTKQKLRSLPPIDAYWHECLYMGTVLPGIDWPEFVSTEALCAGVKEFCKGGRTHSAITSDATVTAIRKLCPKISREQRVIHGRRMRGLVLPCLNDCRQAFEKHIGGKIEW